MFFYYFVDSDICQYDTFLLNSAYCCVDMCKYGYFKIPEIQTSQSNATPLRLKSFFAIQTIRDLFTKISVAVARKNLGRASTGIDQVSGLLCRYSGTGTGNRL